MAEVTTPEKAPRVLQTNVQAPEPTEDPKTIAFGARVHVTAGEGRHVRSPDHGKKPLPETGDWVNWSFYWHRRHEDGDIVVTEPQPDPNAAETPAPETPAAPPAPLPAPPAPSPPPPPAPKPAKPDSDKDA